MRRSTRHESGFSLVETLVAIAIMLTAVASFVQVFGIAAAANQRAGRRTLAMLAALQKMEQLRSTAGAALVASPAEALQDDVAGFNDLFAGGPGQPAFIRRWSIDPLPAAPAHLLVLQVVVLDPGGGVQARIVTLHGTRAV